MTRAVVFAYHDVGVRCLSVLLAHGVEVPLVITHADDPHETIWFASVARLAADYDIPVLTPEDPNEAAVVERVRAASPDFLFSFYYRHLLKAALLDIPRRGALNMHGSLLPKYRGRVPVNWAILHGETETGASLHYMTAKPDAGDLVDQEAVPILPDDTALDVFRKVTCAAERVLHRSLPALIAGCAPRHPLDLSQGSYFGGRKAEDGRIDWSKGARDIHNLVRAVAPPYPGALCTVAHHPARLLRTRLLPQTWAPTLTPSLFVADGRLCLHCRDGGLLRVLELEIDGMPVTAETLPARYDPGPWPVG
jgi:methionyl-tRNA formyltransferase